MSYEKTTWKNGDIITAEKMNKLEDAVASIGDGSKVFVINGEVNGVDSESESGTLSVDKTIDEIKAALEGGNLVLFKLNQAYNPEYQILNDMAGIYGIQYYDFYTAGDWMVWIQQMSYINTNSSRIRIDIAYVQYQETGDPEVPEWTFAYRWKYISGDNE